MFVDHPFGQFLSRFSRIPIFRSSMSVIPSIEVRLPTVPRHQYLPFFIFSYQHVLSSPYIPCLPGSLFHGFSWRRRLRERIQAMMSGYPHNYNAAHVLLLFPSACCFASSREVFCELLSVSPPVFAKFPVRRSDFWTMIEFIVSARCQRVSVFFLIECDCSTSKFH